ncbi:MAG: hypothetical protein Kow0059_14350 [Candidatus Sumerlaeia bacterium]
MRLDRPKSLGERAIEAVRFLIKAALLIGLLVGFYYAERALLYFLYQSPFFSVRYVRVYDLPDKVAGEFLAMPRVQRLKGQNLFLISSRTLAEMLEAIPTLKNVRVRKRFPDTLEIHALERVPVVVVSAVNFYYFDLDGYCVGRVPPGQTPPAAMPIISGVEPLKVRIGKPYGGPTVREGIDLMRLLRDGGFKGLNQISEYHYSEQDGWVLIFTGGSEAKLGCGEMASALARLHYLYDYLEGFERLQTADLRYEGQIPYRLKS